MGKVEVEVDVIIATYNRDDCVAGAIESALHYRNYIRKVIVVVNGSTDNTTSCLAKYRSDEQVDIITLDKNLGAAAGKNIGMRKSDADLVIVIDDDAEFFSEDPVSKVIEKFSNDLTLGIVQFKIVNHEMRKIMKNEFPGNDPATQSDSEFLISSFTGAGHAMRKSMLDDVGYYDDSFFYAHEELDLSFRAIRGGWAIKYIPDVGVYHKKSPKGRLPEKEMIEKMVLHRLIISYRYLPLAYFIVSSWLWIGKAFLWSRSLVVPANALIKFIKERKGISRSAVNSQALEYMKNNFGRLWY